MKEIMLKIGFTPSAKQQEIIDCFLNDQDTDEVVVCCGRQVGKTTTAMYLAIRLSVERANHKLGYFMPTYKQCKKVFRHLVKVFKPMSKMGAVEFNKTDLIIEFSNGSYIQFWSAETDSSRGETYHNIIVDEACFVKDDIYHAAIWGTIAVSMSNKTGKQLLVSTPKAKNWFYDAVNVTVQGRKVFKFTSEQGGIISKEILEKIKQTVPIHVYNNEYMGEFAEEGSGLFQYADCIKVPDDKKGIIAGLDFGFKEDSTVLTILNKSGEMVCCKSWVNKEWQTILSGIKQCLTEYGSPVVYCETNGVGLIPYQELKKAYSNARSWVTSAKSKTDIINSLSTAFHNKEITILPDNEIKAQLEAFSLTYNPKNGSMQFGARSGFHDDIVMSLAIANFNRNTGNINLTRWNR